MRATGALAWFAAVICCATLAAHAADPAPPALKPLDLPEIKASMQMPDGWFLTKQTADGTFVYQVSREKTSGDGEPFKAGFTVSVTTKIPDKFSMTPDQYAESLMLSGQDPDGKPVTVAKSEDAGAKIYRLEYDFQTDAGKSHAVTVARANDKTGTLYIIFWQSPVSDAATLDPLRDKILSTAKFDPAF